MTMHALSETQSSGIELSLDDIHQNALWIPRSSLQNLKEIGIKGIRIWPDFMLC
jgi:hypothetical protein